MGGGGVGGHIERVWVFGGRLGWGVGGEMGKAMVTSENPRQSVENRPTAPNVVRLLASSPKSNRPPAQKPALEIVSKSDASSKPTNMRTLLAAVTLALQGNKCIFW